MKLHKATHDQHHCVGSTASSLALPRGGGTSAIVQNTIVCGRIRPCSKSFYGGV